MVNLTPAMHGDRTSFQVACGGGVARPDAGNAQVLLLDEPLSALDALTRSTLQQELARIWSEERTTCVMITNDIDEAILLADRIVPLTPGPAATLGPSFAVELSRPRDRKELNHDPKFKHLRNAITTWLVDSRKQARRRTPRMTEPIVLPNVAPADLTRGRLRSVLAGTS
jgi:nitrate/nitrite transport system ATP-binding protein